MNEVNYPFFSRINLVEQVYYLYDTKPPRLVSPKSKRGVMTKSLEQIQQENKKFILEAIHGCSYEEALEKEYAKKGNNTISVPLREYEGEELTLSRILLALKDEKIGFYDGCLGEVWKGYKYNWDREDRPASLEYICDWDLTKETLEEQSEETQRATNKLFND